MCDVCLVKNSSFLFQIYSVQVAILLSLFFFVMESSKRPSSSISWAEKKRLCKESPVKRVVSFDFSHVKLELKDWEIMFRCCGVLLKDAPHGTFKILVVCCMDVREQFFKLTSMGTKAEDFYNLLEVYLPSF